MPIKYHLLTFSILTVLLSSCCSVPPPWSQHKNGTNNSSTHSHQGKTHTHPLPSSGIQHSHNQAGSSNNQHIGGVRHSHDGIFHSHSLPNEGLNHSHGGGYYGSSGGNNSGRTYTDTYDYGSYGNTKDSSYYDDGYYDSDYSSSRDSYYDRSYNYDDYGASSEGNYPKFPWRPPLASAMETLPNKFFKGAKTLKDIDNRITSALIKSGYSDRRYYSIPSGFVITTRLEQMNRSGTSKKSPYRWTSERVRSLQDWSLALYLKALFTANVGYYRVIAFSITSEPFVQSSETPTHKFIDSLSLRGANRLNDTIKEKQYTEKFVITAHIYVFKKPEFGKPIFIRPSYLTGREHLIASNIILNLEN